MALLLGAFILSETMRTDVTYLTFHVGVNVSPSFIAFATELTKVSVALLVVLSTTGMKGIVNGPIWTYAVPAALYLFNNILYLVALQLSSPGLLQICVLAKLPLTGVLHHIMIRKQENMYAWISLAAICIGLLVLNLPSDHSPISNPNEGSRFAAPIAGLLIAFVSAVASIYNERLTKKGDFVFSQFWLYLWGACFSGLAMPLSSATKMSAMASPKVDPGAAGILIGTVVMISAATGLLVALILRHGDNLLKLVGTSASVTTICVSQYILFPELRKSTFTVMTVLGGGIVTVGAWCYNYYKDVPSNYAALKSLDAEAGGEQALPLDHWSHPSLRKVSLSTLVIFILAILAA